jgi:threonine dehydrogenase-like Zn-dependent dehydrogenase
VGDRCAVEPYLNCGACIACRRGKPNCCVNLRVLGVHADGGMREVIGVPVAKLHRSSVLSLDQLALVETLGIGAHAVARAALEPDETMLVVGAGPIGLSVTQFALQAGAAVSVMDISERRLAFVHRQWPAVPCILAGGDPLAALRTALGDELPTAAFDATGSPASMMRAFSYVANGGRLIFVGLVQADLTFHDPDFHRRELTLLASRNSTGADFARVIGALESGLIDLAAWITHRASAGEMIAAFPHWMEPESGVIKAMVAF